MWVLAVLVAIGVWATPLGLAIYALVRQQALTREIAKLRLAIAERTPPRPASAAAPTSSPPTRTIPRSYIARRLAQETRPLPVDEKPVLSGGESGNVNATFDAKPPIDWENLIARNWLVWVGAVALALFGLLFAAYAAERGLLGPSVRLGLAVIAGVALLGLGEWRLRKEARDPSSDATRHLPGIFAGAGAITLYGAALAGFWLWKVLPAPLVLISAIGVSLGALALSLRFGPLMAAIGQIGGFIAPLVVPSDQPSLAGLFAYLAVLMAIGGALTAWKAWRFGLWINALGSAFWLFAGAANAHTALSNWLPIAFFAIAAAAWTGFLAGPDARQPLAIALPLRPRHWARAPTLAALAQTVIGYGALLSAVDGSDAAWPIAVLALIAVALGLGASFWRVGLAFCAYGAIAFAAAGAYVAWPDAAIGSLGAEADWLRKIGAPDAPPLSSFFGFCAAGVAVFLAAYAVWPRAASPTALAAAAGFGPLAVLASFYARVTGLEAESLSLALMALLLGALAVLALGRIAQRVGLDAAKGPSAAFALAAVAALGLAALVIADRLWLSSLLAIEAIAIVWLWRRFQIPALLVALSLVAAIIALRLTLFSDAFERVPQGGRLFNDLWLRYGLPAAGLWTAAQLLARPPSPPLSAPRARLAKALEIAAMAILTTGIALLIRQATGGVAYFAPFGAQIASVVGFASLLAVRFNAPEASLTIWIERLAFFGAAFAFHLITLFGGNPWASGAPVAGPPVFNTLLVGYAIPGLAMASYALLARAQGRRRLAHAAGASAVLAFGWWALLSIRHVFHRPFLDVGAIEAAEMWAYSAGGGAFALVLVGLGAFRARPSLRWAGFGLLAAVIVKGFALDVWTIGGIWRPLSMLAIAIVALAIALAWRRLPAPTRA